MSYSYYSTRNNRLTKKEKRTIQRFLTDNIGTDKFPTMNHFIRECRRLQNDGYLGYSGVPFHRLIPYLQDLEQEMHFADGDR